MFTHILVAIKYNDTGRNALKVAAELARIHGAELVALHVIDYRLLAEGVPEAEREQACDAARRRFEQEIGPIFREGGGREFACLPADPAMAVCRLARERGADLVVIGCHQREQGSCLSRMDYTGMTIMDKAPCPVLLVPFSD